MLVLKLIGLKMLLLIFQCHDMTQQLLIDLNYKTHRIDCGCNLKEMKTQIIRVASNL